MEVTFHGTDVIDQHNNHLIPGMFRSTWWRTVWSRSCSNQSAKAGRPSTQRLGQRTVGFHRYCDPFSIETVIGFHRYSDRAFINTLVVFLLIMRIGQATGGRHQYCHENYAILKCAHRHCLAYSNWPITAGRWSIPSKIGILNCQNHHLSTITTNASHDILSISITTSVWTAHRQASWLQRLVRLVQRWLLLTLYVYCQPPKQPSRMPAPGT